MSNKQIDIYQNKHPMIKRKFYIESNKYTGSGNSGDHKDVSPLARGRTGNTQQISQYRFKNHRVLSNTRSKWAARTKGDRVSGDNNVNNTSSNNMITNTYQSHQDAKEGGISVPFFVFPPSNANPNNTKNIPLFKRRQNSEQFVENGFRNHPEGHNPYLPTPTNLDGKLNTIEVDRPSQTAKYNKDKNISHNQISTLNNNSQHIENINISMTNLINFQIQPNSPNTKPKLVIQPQTTKNGPVRNMAQGNINNTNASLSPGRGKAFGVASSGNVIPKDQQTPRANRIHGVPRPPNNPPSNNLPKGHKKVLSMGANPPNIATTAILSSDKDIINNNITIANFPDLEKNLNMIPNGYSNNSVWGSQQQIIANTTIDETNKRDLLASTTTKDRYSLSPKNSPVTELLSNNNSRANVKKLEYPISAGKALKYLSEQLTDYEKGETLDYNNIYFIGENSEKIKGVPQGGYNYGYDDEKGDYNVVMNDHIAYRYQVVGTLGKGSFGQALKVFDHKRKVFIALKIIRNKKRFQHQAVVEVKILKYLRDNDPQDSMNIIRMKDFFLFRKHLCITFELLSMNLYEFIKNNDFQGVSLGLIRRFAIQILHSLRYLHQHGVIHCDIKPENILLRQSNKSGIKIIDFGSSCFEDEIIYTYIQSRFYRAPEIILGIHYTPAIDMWSFGAILAELYSGYPIFPGESEVEQLALIMELKGAPPDYVLDKSTRRKLFFDSSWKPILVPNSRGKIRRPNSKNIHSVLKCNDRHFIEFLEACLEWDPNKRITPEEALMHEWILEGLPPNVLVHHQRIHGGSTSTTHSAHRTIDFDEAEDQNSKQAKLRLPRGKISKNNQQTNSTNFSNTVKKSGKEIQHLGSSGGINFHPLAHTNNSSKGGIDLNKTNQLLLSEKSGNLSLRYEPENKKFSDGKRGNERGSLSHRPAPRFPVANISKNTSPRALIGPQKTLYAIFSNNIKNGNGRGKGPGSIGPNSGIHHASSNSMDVQANTTTGGIHHAKNKSMYINPPNITQQILPPINTSDTIRQNGNQNVDIAPAS